MDADRARATFDALKKLLGPYAKKMTVVHDTPKRYYLDTDHIMTNGKPLFFGSVGIRKRYISYHLMPVYVEPKLLCDLSTPLNKRMQGKSCFNFTSVDVGLFAELAELTQRGFALYADRGYVES
ncbi:MAG: hypothetical protein AAFZ58_08880 [Pseudomonadota bacterium]